MSETRDPTLPDGEEAPALSPERPLVDRALEGDLSAFEELVRRYHKAVFNVCYYKSHNCFDAEDLSQDVFLAAFRALGTLRDPDSFAGWLMGIAYNRCHKWYQRERTKVLKFQELRQRFEQAMRSEHASSQRRAAVDGGGHNAEGTPAELLRRLPNDVREVLELKYLEGWSYQEIQARTGLKTHQIDYLIRKGKKLLRERRAATGGGPS